MNKDLTELERANLKADESIISNYLEALNVRSKGILNYNFINNIDFNAISSNDKYSDLSRISSRLDIFANLAILEFRDNIIKRMLELEREDFRTLSIQVQEIIGKNYE